MDELMAETELFYQKCFEEIKCKLDDQSAVLDLSKDGIDNFMYSWIDKLKLKIINAQQSNVTEAVPIVKKKKREDAVAKDTTNSKKEERATVSFTKSVIYFPETNTVQHLDNEKECKNCDSSKKDIVLDKIGSDVDAATENEVRNIKDTCIALYRQLSDKGNEWKLHLKHGVIAIDCKEIVFKTLEGKIRW